MGSYGIVIAAGSLGVVVVGEDGIASNPMASDGASFVHCSLLFLILKIGLFGCWQMRGRLGWYWGGGEIGSELDIFLNLLQSLVYLPALSVLGLMVSFLVIYEEAVAEELREHEHG